MFLFILESIGTSELLLIGLVALIIFGPRKLPEIAKMLGKARNEFKKTTDEFKDTWMREIDLENQEKQIENEISNDNSIHRSSQPVIKEIQPPQIQEVSQSAFQEAKIETEITVPKPVENNLNDKRDWL